MTSAAKYAESGLVNTKGMFMQAMKDRYAIPAYNFIIWSNFRRF